MPPEAEPSLHWREAIAALEQRIGEQHGFAVRMNGEIECYVEGLESLPHPDVFWAAVLGRLAHHGVPLESIAQEEGPQQFEFRLKPTVPDEAAQAVQRLREQVMAQATEMNLTCSFDAKPYDGAAGSGLQWHLHLENEKGEPVFFKREDELSQPLAQVLGGLLHTMAPLMVCFAPTQASYERFDGAPDHVPRTVSWGGNNRTVALRLPESVTPRRHIEHRVCGADADAWASVWAILAGVYDGLSHARECPAQTYGDASKDCSLMPLPLSMQAAKDARLSKPELQTTPGYEQALKLSC